jgi:hypothetical protein
VGDGRPDQRRFIHVVTRKLIATDDGFSMRLLIAK